jgi:hypothetical protein
MEERPILEKSQHGQAMPKGSVTGRYRGSREGQRPLSLAMPRIRNLP